MRFLKLAGRLSDGFERGKGSRIHAVPTPAPGTRVRALCGAEAGKRSAGWVEVDEDLTVTCPRCITKIARRANRRSLKALAVFKRALKRAELKVVVS